MIYGEVISAYEDATFEEEVTEAEIMEALKESGLEALLKKNLFPEYVE